MGKRAPTSRQRIAVIQETNMGHRESWKSFGRRVETLTRVSLDNIPTGEIADLHGHKVICRRGKTLVVRVEDPVVVRQKDLEGEYSFEPIDDAEHFRVVTLD